MKWYLEVLKKYAVFRGRARRQEYWFFVLFNLIIYFIFGAVNFFGQISAIVGSLDHTSVMSGAVLGVISRLGEIYMLAVLIPSIAVTVRRLHDTGRSGWLQLIALIPLVGVIVLIVFLTTDSQPGDNEYGANPKTIET